MMDEPWRSAFILFPMGTIAIMALWLAVVFGEVPPIGLAMTIWMTIVVPIGLVLGFADALKHQKECRIAQEKDK